MNRKLERFLIAIASGACFGLAGVGGVDWLVECFADFMAILFGVVFALYALELAIANGLEMRRSDDLEARRQVRDAERGRAA